MAFRVNSITTNTGDVLNLASLSIVVGANNVGKSRLLREINSRITNPRPDDGIIADVSFTLPSADSLLHDFDIAPTRQPADGSLRAFFLASTLDSTTQIYFGNNEALNSFKTEWNASATAALATRPPIGNAFVSYLTTQNRLSIIGASSSTRDEGGGPKSVLQRIFDIPNAEELINADLMRLFGTKIRLDFTKLSQLRLRVGPDIDGLPKDPREARSQLEQYELLDEQGDGIRAFVALYFALNVIDRPCLLIDEPEAFLHPPQAYAFGRLCGAHESASKQIIVATHSVDFIRGVLSSASQPALIRLSRDGSLNPITFIASADVRRIAKDPISSSAGVLGGLFFFIGRCNGSRC